MFATWEFSTREPTSMILVEVDFLLKLIFLLDFIIYLYGISWYSIF